MPRMEQGRGWSQQYYFTYDPSSNHRIFEPSCLVAIRNAVREWLSAKDAYEAEHKYEEILSFRFGGYFVGAQDQTEICRDLMAACVESCRCEN
jgi:hypothetical protein